MATHVIHQEKISRISQHGVSTFKVIIVGRDPLTASLLADSLTNNLSCESVTARHSELLRMLGSSAADLVIISADLNSIAGAGFDLASAVSAAYPSTPIIILLDEPVSDLVIRAFISGARGVFNPQDSMTDFIDCVERVRKGAIWARKEVSDYLMDALKSIPAPGLLNGDPSSLLSTRELQVVQCAARGKTNKAIAGELGSSSIPMNRKRDAEATFPQGNAAWQETGEGRTNASAAPAHLLAATSGCYPWIAGAIADTVGQPSEAHKADWNLTGAGRCQIRQDFAKSGRKLEAVARKPRSEDQSRPLWMVVHEEMLIMRHYVQAGLHPRHPF